jgi:hypothetical protein
VKHVVELAACLQAFGLWLQLQSARVTEDFPSQNTTGPHAVLRRTRWGQITRASVWEGILATRAEGIRRNRGAWAAGKEGGDSLEGQRSKIQCVCLVYFQGIKGT